MVRPGQCRWLRAETDLECVVEGGRGWEIMDGLDRTMPGWLGEEPTQRLREHLKTVAQVRVWTSDYSLILLDGRSNERLSLAGRMLIH